ncbi:unnamed protein product [Prunus armeniaca]
MEKVDTKIMVPFDVCTRWNSTYMMLESALKIQKGFERMEEDDPNFLGYFEEYEAHGSPDKNLSIFVRLKGVKMRKEPPRGEEVALAAPNCYCGRLAWLQTSWTKSNPLWRFFVCPKSDRGKKGCGFFVWVDIEMPPCERALIAWLLRTKREFEDQISVV